MSVRLTETRTKSGVFFDDKEVIKMLETKFGRTRMRRIQDKALLAAGAVVLEAVRLNIRYFRDTGAEYGEAKMSKPEWVDGQRSVRIYWEGPQHRYSIVHLSEKGFHARNGKFIRPKGMGAIERAMRSAKKTFYKVFSEEMERLL